MIQELVSTPEGTFALFIFLFGGVLVGGMAVAALTDKDFHHMCSDLFFGGIKCKSCKRRSKEWTQWHQRKGESDYTGYEWCPFCSAKRYEGFSDRVF